MLCGKTRWPKKIYSSISLPDETRKGRYAMKQTQEYVKAQENMKPGVITAEGFLGTDHRPLADIIEADEEVLNKLNLDVSALASRMRELLEAGKRDLESQ